MKIIIRPIKDTDYDRVSIIMDQVHQLHVGWRPDVYKDISPVISTADYAEMLIGNEWFVAEADGVVAGILKLLERHMESPIQKPKNILHISTMAVDEKYRGCGIGHAFFQKVQEIKTEKQFDSIELQVNAKNSQAYEMYKKYGFTEKSINMELK